MRKAVRSVDFYGDILAPRIEECRDHFDIEPFYKFAIGTYVKEGVSGDFFTHYHETGRLIVPEKLKNDEVALKCVAFVEARWLVEQAANILM